MPTRTRRLALALILVPFLALAGAGLSGCGVPPPLNPAPPAPTGPTPVGVNVDAPDHSVALRDVLLPDPGATGYPAGGSAPVALQVWNNTNKPVSLTKATAAGSAPVILVSTGETPAPAGDPSFVVLVPPGANVTLSQQAGRFLLIRCVPVKLAAGTSVPMTFTFDNGVTLAVEVPVGLVISAPASNASAAPAC